MASLKISQLTAATGTNYTDTVPIVQTGSTKKVAMSLFALRWGGSSWDANSSKLTSLASGVATGEALHFGQVLGSTEIASAGYTVTDSDGVVNIFVTTGASDRTITLPTLADNQGRILTIHKIDSGAGGVIVDGEGAETINGSATIKMLNQYETVSIKAMSTEWSITNQMNQNNWTSYTPTFSSGFGTVASVSFKFRRCGPDVIIRGLWTNGTVAAATCSITLPTGHTIDTSAMPSKAEFGLWHALHTGGTSMWGASNTDGVAFYNTNTDRVWLATNTTSNDFQQSNGDGFLTSSIPNTIEMRIPISEYSL